MERQRDKMTVLQSERVTHIESQRDRFKKGQVSEGAELQRDRVMERQSNRETEFQIEREKVI